MAVRRASNSRSFVANDATSPAVSTATTKPRNALLYIFPFALERAVSLARVVPFGQGNHLFHRLRRQGVQFDGLQHGFVHLGQSDVPVATSRNRAGSRRMRLAG